MCPEARVKFKNIDFRSEANFACYCTINEDFPSLDQFLRPTSRKEGWTEEPRNTEYTVQGSRFR